MGSNSSSQVTIPRDHSQYDMSKMACMDHSAMGQSGMNSSGMFLMNESSRTGFQPAAWPMPMLMTTDVGTVLPLEEARKAHEMLGGAQHGRGKIVLSIAA